MAGTLFSAVYNRFLEKITDDMYMELTPEDTLKDLQRLLIDALPGFEFPRVNLFDYTLQQVRIREDEVFEDDFIIGVVWTDIPDEIEPSIPDVIVDRSYFGVDLTSEEINILACIMKQGWVQRQVSSIEVTRMKYTGSDFKMTSQANHLQKLLSLLEESRRDQFHMQRLYKRRRLTSDGRYESNWDTLNHHVKHTYRWY